MIYFVSYQCKKSKQIILCRALGDGVNIGHYLMLGAYSGCGTLVICVINGLLCGNTKYKWASWTGWKWIMSLALIVTCILTRQEPHPWLSSICTLVSILAVVWTAWSGNAGIIRLGKILVVGPFWIVYCILVGSIPGVVNECIGIASALISMHRYGMK